MFDWIDDEAMPTDRVVGAWNQKPPFADLAPDPAQRRDALDEIRMVIRIKGRNDDPIVAMSLLELLPVPHMRLIASQNDTHDALVGIGVSVAKCPISQAPLIDSEQLRESMGDLRPFAVFLVESVVITVEGMDGGIGILVDMETAVASRRMQNDAFGELP